jgi:hypothetical protein
LNRRLKDDKPEMFLVQTLLVLTMLPFIEENRTKRFKLHLCVRIIIIALPYKDKILKNKGVKEVLWKKKRRSIS